MIENRSREMITIKKDLNGNSKIGKFSIYKLKTSLDGINSILDSLAERISRSIQKWSREIILSEDRPVGLIPSDLKTDQ